jgi:hypothetical protein
MNPPCVVRRPTSCGISSPPSTVSPPSEGRGQAVCSRCARTPRTGQHRPAQDGTTQRHSKDRPAPHGHRHTGWHRPVRPLNPRVRGSSPWRRTIDQGSDLGDPPGSEPLSCPLWSPVCSWCALEPSQPWGPAMPATASGTGSTDSRPAHSTSRFAGVPRRNGVGYRTCSTSRTGRASDRARPSATVHACHDGDAPGVTWMACVLPAPGGTSSHAI